MRFSVRFKIGNRLGAKSIYTLKEICVSIVDRYDLKESEIANIATLRVDEVFTNSNMEVTKVSHT